MPIHLEIKNKTKNMKYKMLQKNSSKIIKKKIILRLN